MARRYEFAGGGQLGVTVASPIFDTSHSSDAPRLIGVVGLDVDFSHMEALAGGGRDARTVAYKALNARIKSKCPTNFKVGGCPLQVTITWLAKGR